MAKRQLTSMPVHELPSRAAPGSLVRHRAVEPRARSSGVQWIAASDQATRLPSGPDQSVREPRAVDAAGCALPAASAFDARSGMLLGGVAGATDAAGWVALAGLLPSHLTASLVMLGASGEHDSSEVTARLAMIPVFVVAVALVKGLARWLAARQLPVLQPLLTLLTVALAVFCIAGSSVDALLVDDPRVVLCVGGLGVASMAVQNTIMRLCLPQHNPTTVMTGNLTLFVMASVDLLACRLSRAAPPAHEAALRRRELHARLASSGLPLLGFVLGSVSCGLLASRQGLSCLILPVALSAITTVRGWRAWGRLRAHGQRVALPERPFGMSLALPRRSWL